MSVAEPDKLLSETAFLQFERRAEVRSGFPILIGEVLSDSTDADYRGKKFAHCRFMPSLRHFLLVGQKEPRFELFSHGGGDEWRWREARGLDATLDLPALETTIALSEVFARVEFGSAPMHLHP